MTVKVFLKFNRDRAETYTIACLRFWLEAFKEYETYILCDLFKANEVPDYFKHLLKEYPATIINSDYSIGAKFQNMKKAKRNMASANITPFKYLNGADSFWIIDADDTLFLGASTTSVREKLKKAEEHLKNNNLDGFSLDFYRNLNDGWTFGVCLISAKCPWEKIATLTDEEINASGYARNIDTAFDLLHKKGIFRLANFVFDGLAFQHVVNNYPEMPHGIYIWHRGRLWDKPLQPDVVVL